MTRHLQDTVVMPLPQEPVPFIQASEAGEGAGDGRVVVPPSPLKALLKQHFGGNKTTGSPHGKQPPGHGWGQHGNERNSGAPMTGWNQSSAASPRSHRAPRGY